MKPKILIVDDDPIMHLLYKRPLDAAGYELLSARNSEEATKLLSQEPPQLIIMDIMMPGTDGLSMLRALKHSETGPKIPVIVVTANLERYTTVKRESEASGAVAFLSKPLSPARLVAEVRRFVVSPANPEPPNRPS
jgi:CheY-like chemotaxis protein